MMYAANTAKPIAYTQGDEEVVLADLAPYWIIRVGIVVSCAKRAEDPTKLKITKEINLINISTPLFCKHFKAQKKRAEKGGARIYHGEGSKTMNEEEIKREVLDRTVPSAAERKKIMKAVGELRAGISGEPRRVTPKTNCAQAGDCSRRHREEGIASEYLRYVFRSWGFSVKRNTYA